MTVITQRDVIRQVVKRFTATYGNEKLDGRSWKPGESRRDILDKLRTLDLETVAPQVVDEIIGNNSWTTVETCSECRAHKLTWVLQVGQEPDYESTTAWLCRDCVAKAASLL